MFDAPVRSVPSEEREHLSINVPEDREKDVKTGAQGISVASAVRNLNEVIRRIPREIV